MRDPDVEWETCAADDCVGVRLPIGQKCWAHAADADLEVALKRLGEDGCLDARGVQISRKLLERLIAAAPQDGHGHTVLTDTRFDKATFQSGAAFAGALFRGDANFYKARFQGDANFNDARFQDRPSFDRATFEGRAHFERATFEGRAVFDRAMFFDDVNSRSDGTVVAWDLNSGQFIYTLSGHETNVMAIALTNDGRVVTGGDDRIAIVWDLARGQAVAVWYADHVVTAVGWSERTSTVILGDAGGGVHILRFQF